MILTQSLIPPLGGSETLAWGATFISALGVYLVSYKDIKGQYVHLAGNLAWILFGVLSDQLFLIPLNLFYFTITLKNLNQWRQ